VRLDEVAEELYAAPPGEFVAVRDEHVRRAKEAGDRELATRLGKLRRPTQSAWLVNLLWRQRRELIQELLTLGAEFRGEELTRQRLHELSTRRRELLHRLLSEAQRLSDDAGVRLSADRALEIESTLAAAVADPDAAQQVRGGRLVTALSYSGLGPELQFIPDASPTAATGTGPATGVGPGPAAGSGAGGPAAPTAEARAAAERLVYQRTEAWENAIRQRDGLVRRRDELRLELRRAEQRLDRAEEELTEAEQLVQACAESLEQARRAAGQA
jgi:hypothetical protein